MQTKRNITATVVSLVGLTLFLAWAGNSMDNYKVRILNLAAINIILGASQNLIYGYTGQFSLGQAGFMAIGAYTSALLTMTEAQKSVNFFMMPLIAPLDKLQIPFFPAVILGGLLAGLFALLIGIPALKLRGDYLGIATLGFAEIIRVVANNLQSITNGALGLKGIPDYTNLWWSWGSAVFTILVIVQLVRSSYGNALKCIREDEIAAEAMGVSLVYHKVLSFVISAFFAGVGGALLANLIGTIDPKTFNFFLTFQVLMIVVVGGLGSTTGSVIAAVVYTVLMEALRWIEAPIDLGFIHIPGIPGMRMVIFSILLLAIIVFYRQGLLGTNEFSWDWLFSKFSKKRGEPYGPAQSR